MIWIILGAVIIMGSQSQIVQDKIEENLDSWTRFDSAFKKYAQKYNIDWKWLKAIALNESSLGKASSVERGLNFPEDVEGSKSTDGKSWGLMQVTVTTAKDFDLTATPQKLNDPNYSIEIACKYINWVKKQFSSTDNKYMEWVVKSYNQGVGNTKKEISKKISKGYADEYWARFQRNLERVNNTSV